MSNLLLLQQHIQRVSLWYFLCERPKEYFSAWNFSFANLQVNSGDTYIKIKKSIPKFLELCEYLGCSNFPGDTKNIYTSTNNMWVGVYTALANKHKESEVRAAFLVYWINYVAKKTNMSVLDYRVLENVAYLYESVINDLYAVALMYVCCARITRAGKLPGATFDSIIHLPKETIHYIISNFNFEVVTVLNIAMEALLLVNSKWKYDRIGTIVSNLQFNIHSDLYVDIMVLLFNIDRVSVSQQINVLAALQLLHERTSDVNYLLLNASKIRSRVIVNAISTTNIDDARSDLLDYKRKQEKSILDWKSASMLKVEEERKKVYIKVNIADKDLHSLVQQSNVEYATKLSSLNTQVAEITVSMNETAELLLKKSRSLKHVVRKLRVGVQFGYSRGGNKLNVFWSSTRSNYILPVINIMPIFASVDIVSKVDREVHENKVSVRKIL